MRFLFSVLRLVVCFALVFVGYCFFLALAHSHRRYLMSTKAIGLFNRSQVDFEAQAIAARSCIIACPPEESQTRQEMLADSDIQSVLARYGAFPVSNRPVEYGEIDTDLDLTGAYARVDQARRDFENLPASIRSRFSSWEDLAQAMMTLDLDSIPPDDPEPVEAGVPPAAKGSVPPGGPPEAKP